MSCLTGEVRGVDQVGSYTNFFADSLAAEAEEDTRVIGIHAAMGGGTGMNRFEQRFPDRTFDVGIAEQVPAPPILPPIWNMFLQNVVLFCVCSVRMRMHSCWCACHMPSFLVIVTDYICCNVIPFTWIRPLECLVL